MGRDYTPIPFEFLDELDCLSDDEYGRLIRAMQKYSIDGEEIQLPGNEKMFWKRCRNTVDRYKSSYESRLTANIENGKKGGRPKKQSLVLESEENPKNPMVFSETQKSHTKTKPKANTKTNITPIAPKGADFDLFWQAYPKKVGKDAARKAFGRVKVPVESLLTAIEQQKCGRQWQEDDGKYIPNPATWLNQGRWQDEVQVVQKPTWDDGHRELDEDEKAAIGRMFEGKEENRYEMLQRI